MENKKQILTPKLAQKIQDGIFKKMTAVQKINMVGQFFELGKKLNSLNDRRKNGNNGVSHKNS
ncbi:MAG: hypothetical protein EXS48_02010 [Candidatus Staskawiczbacteria bacterium]|nr:hypothetical protein [Candidatus Staskawiczbacteria bacterium]